MDLPNKRYCFDPSKSYYLWYSADDHNLSESDNHGTAKTDVFVRLICSGSTYNPPVGPISYKTNDWVEIFDCLTKDKRAKFSQLVNRDDVMKIMKTAEYIAICDHGSHPSKKNACVYAKRGSEPFNNLAKGATISKSTKACNLNCIKQSWSGDAQRLNWMSWTCGNGSDDYSKGLIYQAGCNAQGLHMFTYDGEHDACGWNNDLTKFPSVWLQTIQAAPDSSFYLTNNACKPYTNCEEEGKVQTKAGSGTTDVVCGRLKQCTCANGGEGAKGTACPKDNDAKCVSCTGKFFLNGTKCKAWTNCFNQGRVRKKAGTGSTDTECGWQPGTFLALSLCLPPSVSLSLVWRCLSAAAAGLCLVETEYCLCLCSRTVCLCPRTVVPMRPSKYMWPNTACD